MRIFTVYRSTMAILTPCFLQNSQVRDAPESHDRIAHLEFLYGLYWPQYYMMEVWECARRLLLTGLPVLYLRGTASQCASGMIVCFVAVVAISCLRPCIDNTNTIILSAANVAQYLLLFAGLLVVAGTAEEDGYDLNTFGVVLVLINMSILLAIAGGILIEVSSTAALSHLRPCVHVAIINLMLFPLPSPCP